MSARPGFQCDGCGECCRRHRVPVTHADVRRLRNVVPALDGRLDWLGPEDVDMEGEPETFVRLSTGRRLLVLAHARSAGGTACVFLDERSRCVVYGQRPACCRTYPFEALQPAGGKNRCLPLHDAVLCKPSTHAVDAPASRPVVEALAARDTELADYVDLVARWNRRQRRRELGGRRPEPPATYLEWLAVAGDRL